MKKEILFQLDIVWQLFLYHCNDLGEQEALWCKLPDGLCIRKTENKWIADWPETEIYTIGPPSIAWTLWHILYWWNTTLCACDGAAIPSKEAILWPGSVQDAIQQVHDCHNRWVAFVSSLEESEFQSTNRCRWPFEGQSFASLALWLNAELMKNAVEIGTGRFLYAAEAKQNGV